MKKTLVVLAVCVVAVGAFAQGKVTFGNDANHLIVINSDPALAKNDAALAGVAAPQIGTASDVMSSLKAQLWGGLDAGSMTLQSTLDPAGFAGLADGRLANASVTLTGIAGGATGFFQILIFESSAADYAAASTGTELWYASTPVFSGAAGGFAPTPLTSFATWTAGDITLTANPIVPEPSTLALAGLGIASLLLFRRRK